VYGPSSPQAKQWAAARSAQLDDGDVEAVITSMNRLRPRQSNVREEVRKRWTVAHANAIIALRCCHLSGRWEEFWEQRSVG
jgi:hypothetical protein